jgi:sugar O-acyltransferase (sialic acid O-acetyltransferase NeuD family)
MTKRLIILGTSGNASDVLDILDAINALSPTWQVAGFLDDGRAPGSDHLGFPVLGAIQEAARFSDCYFINAIGSDRSYRRRPEIVTSTGLARERFATLLHPSASASSRARLGLGTYMNYGVSIAGSVRIGDQVALGPGCIIGHDSVIEDFATLAPSAVVSGFVSIGHSCYVGARAVIRQHVRIGERALIGMGAVVLRDVPPDTVVVGNPARPLEERMPGRPGCAQTTSTRSTRNYQQARTS